MKGKSVPAPGGQAGKILKKGETALFYFYSPSWGVCKAMTPVVKGLSREKDNVSAIDISSNMETARKFNVMAIPTLVIIKERIVRDILIGP